MIELGIFDLETTGVDVHNDLIVTAYVGLLDANGEVVRYQDWIVNPGIPIPEGAAAVHGWTTERLNDPTNTRIRQDPDAVVLEIAQLLYNLCGAADGPRYPLGGHNLAYDLSLLKASLARLPQPMPLPTTGPDGIRVLDSLVLDKHFNKFVRGTGQRKLIPTAARYGIQLTDEQAHAADFDAIAAGRIIQKIVDRYSHAGAIDNLHQGQIIWRAEQQTSLQAYLRSPKGGEPDAICEPGWPTTF